jgi:acyl carrier protein
MNYTDIVIEAIAKLIKKSTTDIFITDSLQDDLQLDSLDIVELLMDIEDELIQDLDAATFENCKTVGDLIDILKRK